MADFRHIFERVINDAAGWTATDILDAKVIELCPCVEHDGRVPGHMRGSNWPWVPCDHQEAPTIGLMLSQWKELRRYSTIFNSLAWKILLAAGEVDEGTTMYQSADPIDIVHTFEVLMARLTDSPTSKEPTP